MKGESKDRKKWNTDSAIRYCIVTAADSEVPSIAGQRLVSAAEESGVVRHTGNLMRLTVKGEAGGLDENRIARRAHS